MNNRVGRLLLSLAMVAVLSQGAAAEVYVRPSLSLHNRIDTIWPKCFYKYLTVDLGHRSGNRDLSLSVNFLDNVEVFTAYRIAYPYQIKAAWALPEESRLEVSALSTNPVQGRLERTDLIEFKYARSLPSVGAGGRKLEVFGIVRGFPTEGWAWSVSPGATLRQNLGGAELSLSLNGLAAKDYATLSRDNHVVSLGADWAMHGGSRIVATLNTLLGAGEAPQARTWLDLRFLFGPLYEQ